MFSTDARPGASAERTAAKPLSPLGTIGVAGTTAAVVFAVGVYLVEHGWTEVSAPSRQDVDAVAENARVTTSSVLLAAPTPGAPGAGSALVASAAAPKPTAPLPTSDLAGASPAVEKAAKGPVALEKAVAAPRKGTGALRVLSARDATVYVTGVAVGPTNQRVEARCGRSFVRLGEPTPNGTRWLGVGRTVIVKCEALTEVDF